MNACSKTTTFADFHFLEGGGNFSALRAEALCKIRMAKAEAVSDGGVLLRKEIQNSKASDPLKRSSLKEG